MKYLKTTMDRRMFIRGSGGVIMALPFLDSVFSTRQAMAQQFNQERPVYFVCVRGGNGVAQRTNSGEPEKFWPMEYGRLTRQMLEMRDGDNDIRTCGLLSDHADDLLIVDGTRYMYPGNGCGHSGGGNQCLTGTPPSGSPSGNRSLATGESLDHFIQRVMRPDDPEPLTLMGGRTSSYLNEVLSYAPPAPGESNGRLRAAERNPWDVYRSIFGDPSQSADEFLEYQIAQQRLSVNDLLREQIDDLKRQPGLSTADRNRLELHQQSIRDLEERMLACHLAETDWRSIEAVGASGEWRDAANAESMLYMLFDIVALAFACDLKRSATIQIGNGNDQTVYDIDGPRYPFHWISHRIQGDGSPGSADPIGDAARLHYEIDKIHARWFDYLIHRLKEYSTDRGTLLDDTVALWTNDLADGVAHSYRNLPMVIAGGGGGYLRTGHYINARETATPVGGHVPHQQLFNTIINATGIRKSDGSPVDDFGHRGGNGHDAAPGGEIPGMKA